MDMSPNTAMRSPMLHPVAALVTQVGRCPALFLDYDGTLAPIQPRPEQATLDPEVRRTLQQLAQRHPVAIVSGRERTDVEQLVGLPELIYAGSHGLDIAGPGIRWDSPQAGHLLPTLDRAFERLEAGTSGLQGIWVERKRYAVAVHYRLADEHVASQAQQVVTQLAGELKGLNLAGGKKLWELRPDIDWNKGRAIEWLCAQLHRSDPKTYRPVFIGDDETDEDGFRAVAGLGGIGVLVAPSDRASAAICRLSSVNEVAELLEALNGAA